MTHLYTEGTQRIPEKVFTLSREVDESKPLLRGLLRRGLLTPCWGIGAS